MLQVSAQLVERRIYGPDQELRLRAPAIAGRLSAGQPVLVRGSWGLAPYLRRAFYPVAFDAETWTLRLAPDGDWGHAWLAAAPLGAALDCLGPVGNGFTVPPGRRNLLCLGEGDAAWALLPLIWQAAGQGLSVTLAVETAGRRMSISPARLPETVEYRVVSAGAQHNSSWLSDLLPWADALLAAGSLDFYRRLAPAAQTARFGVSRGFAQVLYPAAILCGTGACGACAADVAGGRRRVCLRGPVFDLADLAPL